MSDTPISSFCNADDLALLRMSIEEAREEKFQKGRREHGPVFLKDPLVEADQEFLDLMNYCDEASRRGHDPFAIGEIRELVDRAAAKVRALIARDGLIDHSGTRYQI